MLRVEYWEEALQQCAAPSSQQRSEAIDRLTELFQHNKWELPPGQGPDIFTALRERLNDSNWCARRNARPRLAGGAVGVAAGRAAHDVCMLPCAGR